jgi:hypothetical protein
VRDPASNIEVAILPEMRIATGDGVFVEYGNFKLALTGIADYGLVRYRAEYKGRCWDSLILRTAFTILQTIYSGWCQASRIFGSSPRAMAS